MRSCFKAWVRTSCSWRETSIHLSRIVLNFFQNDVQEEMEQLKELNPKKRKKVWYFFQHRGLHSQTRLVPHTLDGQKGPSILWHAIHRKDIKWLFWVAFQNNFYVVLIDFAERVL